jgi:hypothetical protein
MTLDRLERSLINRFHQQCPGSHELGEYYMALLPRTTMQAIGAHLERCSVCQAELQELTQFLTEDQRSPLGQMIDVIVQWGRGLTTGHQGAALPGIRGDAGGGQTFEAGDLWLTVKVREREDGLRDLLGLVTSADGSQLPAGVAWVHQDGRYCAGATLDAKGNLVITGLPPGEYDLSVEYAEIRVCVRGVTL